MIPNVLEVHGDYPKAKAWEDLIAIIEAKGFKFSIYKSVYDQVLEIIEKGLQTKEPVNPTVADLLFCRNAICGLVDAIDYGKANKAVKRIDEAIKLIGAQSEPGGEILHQPTSAIMPPEEPAAQ